MCRMPASEFSKASKKEQKFVQDGAKHVMALNDLKGQVRAAVDPAMGSGWMVTTATGVDAVRFVTEGEDLPVPLPGGALTALSPGVRVVSPRTRSDRPAAF